RRPRPIGRLSCAVASRPPNALLPAPMRSSPLLLAAVFAAALPPVHAHNPRPTGKINDIYAQLCANCHGKILECGQAQSMLDDVWVNGGDDESLMRSIRQGFPDKGMPAWGDSIPEKEIRAMVVFIRERRANHEREKTKFQKPQESMAVKSQLHSYQLDTW